MRLLLLPMNALLLGLLLLPIAASEPSDSLQAWTLKEATRSNNNTARLWEEFGPHRSRVTALLEELHQRVFKAGDVEPPSAPHGTLCLLGAGNSNDVDLRRLLRRYEAIELVDLDGAALTRGTANILHAKERLVLHGGIDLLGISDGVASVYGNGATAAAAVAALERGAVASTLRSLLGRRCDVATATALFAMLVQQVQRHLGISDTMPLEERAAHGWDDALSALSRSYLAGLAEAVRPGGAIAHVSTLVYKPGALPGGTYGEEQMWEEHISRGDFFPSTNPYAWLEMDANGRLHSAELWRGGDLGGDEAPYWVWRSSVAYGVSWRRSADV